MTFVNVLCRPGKEYSEQCILHRHIKTENNQIFKCTNLNAARQKFLKFTFLEGGTLHKCPILLLINFLWKSWLVLVSPFNKANIGATYGNILTSDIQIFARYSGAFQRREMYFWKDEFELLPDFAHYEVFNSYQTLKLESSGITRNYVNILCILLTVYQQF